MPNLSAPLGSRFFQGCSSLVNIVAPKVTQLYFSAFEGCSLLSTLNFPNVSIILTGAFSLCFNLRSLYLFSADLVSLAASHAFSYTPVAGYWHSSYCIKPNVYGSVFVPYSLLDNYKASTNWAYFSNRIGAAVPFSVTNLSESDSITTFVEGKESPIPLEVPATEFTYSVYSKYPKYTGTQADMDENGEINITLPTEGVTLTVNTTPEDATVKITEDGLVDAYAKTKLLNSGDVVDRKSVV